ncbi:unnamed protein product [Malassezia sympodialis ATCC 42132]|uniref:uncharacterized protein n=1 Tax=Malassezia sympodialis (strain ATCC 42132) TaxID=1230383 RepID=UPI0002C1C921|nr:uncharacterized protein MSY001_2819 [Malassezia sympodialis ATCC 42132]CCV00114.1 unnamed protein product [Malassezia sympodialis ATCC 42132]|eukprot:XP_018741323.1 uncharacterized protein MSY001_2819 [Malassezia sympodialis ATCC 42132]
MHVVAQKGFHATGSSGLYDRARPSYPPALIRQLLAATGTRSPRVVEVGAGTGIATRLLLQESAHVGGLSSLAAFDPSQGMLEHLRRVLGNNDTGLVAALKAQGRLRPESRVWAAEGAFDDFQAGTGNDLVVIAQAWHWCPDFDAALRHIAASLRPGGVLALLWNLEDRDAGTLRIPTESGMGSESA